MKNLELRLSLIKSGVLIGLLIFFIYAFAAGDSGGVGGTLGSLISAITFVVGLCLAVLVSVVVMFGIYFGILYLYDAEVSKTVFGELQETLSKVSKQFPCGSTCCTSKIKEIPPVLTTDELQPLQLAQNKLSTQLATTDATVDSLQKTVTTLNAAINSANEELLALNEKANVIQEGLEEKASTDAIAESAKKLGTDISSSIKPLGVKIAVLEETVSNLATDNDDDDADDGVQEKIDKAVAAMQKELTALKKSMASPKTQTAAVDVEESRHRILEYFGNKKDENKFVKLVKEKVTKDMTYAQVDEFLVDSLSKEAAAILADHPSLTKDYIRTNRQKG